MVRRKRGQKLCNTCWRVLMMDMESNLRKHRNGTEGKEENSGRAK